MVAISFLMESAWISQVDKDKASKKLECWTQRKNIERNNAETLKDVK